jgi:hypothetical protein
VRTSASLRAYLTSLRALVLEGAYHSTLGDRVVVIPWRTWDLGCIREEKWNKACLHSLRTPATLVRLRDCTSFNHLVLADPCILCAPWMETGVPMARATRSVFLASYSGRIRLPCNLRCLEISDSLAKAADLSSCDLRRPVALERERIRSSLPHHLSAKC